MSAGDLVYQCGAVRATDWGDGSGEAQLDLHGGLINPDEAAALGMALVSWAFHHGARPPGTPLADIEEAIR